MIALKTPWTPIATASLVALSLPFLRSLLTSISMYDVKIPRSWTSFIKENLPARSNTIRSERIAVEYA